MINVHPVKIFKDNYIWVLHDKVYAIVVDPGSSNEIISFLQKNNLKLVAILVTHRHSDHTDGIGELIRLFNIPVYGPKSQAIPLVSNQVSEGQKILSEVLGITFTVLEMPGHTREHIGYSIEHPFNGVFCGDTLFSCGCGRAFEGTYEQMYASLNKLSQLPDDTRIYCTHEYTLDNIRFAKCVDPENLTLLKYESLCEQLRTEQKPTLPTQIALEKTINPFLRCNDSKIIASAQNYSQQFTNNPVEIFSILRQWKDNFSKKSDCSNEKAI